MRSASMLDREIAAVVSLYTCRPLRADWEKEKFEANGLSVFTLTGQWPGSPNQSFKKTEKSGNLTRSQNQPKRDILSKDLLIQPGWWLTRSPQVGWFFPSLNDQGDDVDGLYDNMSNQPQ